MSRGVSCLPVSGFLSQNRQSDWWSPEWGVDYTGCEVLVQMPVWCKCFARQSCPVVMRNLIIPEFQTHSETGFLVYLHCASFVCISIFFLWLLVFLCNLLLICTVFLGYSELLCHSLSRYLQLYNSNLITLLNLNFSDVRHSWCNSLTASDCWNDEYWDRSVTFFRLKNSFIKSILVTNCILVLLVIVLLFYYFGNCNVVLANHWPR